MHDTKASNKLVLEHMLRQWKFAKISSYLNKVLLTKSCFKEYKIILFTENNFQLPIFHTAIQFFSYTTFPTKK